MSYSFIKEAKSASELKARYDRVKGRFTQIYADWDTGDAWRYLLRDELEAIIWGNAGENIDRRTIPRTDARSVTDTVISFLSGNEPKIHVEPSNPVHLGEQDRSSFSEKIGLYTFQRLDENRIESLLKEVNDFAVHRGCIVGKNLWLSPDERGERRSRAEQEETAATEADLEGAQIFSDPLEADFEDLDNLFPQAGDVGGRLAVNEELESFAPLFPADSFSDEVIVEEGDFPLCIDLIDPRECAWVLDSKGHVIEFYHGFETTVDVLISTYPDILKRDEFREIHRAGSGDRKVRVLDCWDREYNAILINDRYYKEPKKHGYHCCPVVVEIVNGERVRNGDGSYELRPGPFTKPIYESLKWASWAESMSATHLARSTFMPPVHRGISSDGSSPYTTMEEGENGEDTMAYNSVMDFSPDGGPIPLFDDEDLSYPHPPPIVQILQEFKDQRLRDISIVTFADGILSGLVKADLSGYSASLQTQAAMARIEPYKQGGNRFLSRSLKMLFRIGFENWDRDDGFPLLLEVVAGEAEAERELTREMFQAVGKVTVEIIPDVRVDRENVSKELYEGLSLGVVSQLTVVDKLGHVRDPQAELERIAFERVSTDPSHPMYQQASGALVDNYMRKNRLGPYAEGAGQAQPPPPPDPAAPPMDPGMMGGGMPMDPGMMGGMPPMDPGMMGGGMPPMDPGMMGAGPPMDPGMAAGGEAPPMDPAMLMQLMGG